MSLISKKQYSDNTHRKNHNGGQNSDFLLKKNPSHTFFFFNECGLLSQYI